MGCRLNPPEITRSLYLRIYSERVISGGFSLQPIIFESSGLLHPKFLTQCAQYAGPLRLAQALCFFIKRLSVTLQRTIANGVNMRLMRLASHSDIHNNPSFLHSAMLEASE